MKKISIDMDKCHAVQLQSCSICDIEYPGLLGQVRAYGSVPFTPWVERSVIPKLVASCPGNAIIINE